MVDLLQVSKTTGWIISSGLDKGFVKVIGDAVHQYGYPFPCIGITREFCDSAL